MVMKNNPITKDLFLTALQCPSRVYYDGHNEGIIIEPDSDGSYTIESTWNQCEELITQYSLLGHESI